MKLILFDNQGTLSVYNASQLLFVKLTAKKALIRFSGDLTTYITDTEEAKQLLTWLRGASLNKTNLFSFAHSAVSTYPNTKAT